MLFSVFDILINEVNIYLTNNFLLCNLNLVKFVIIIQKKKHNM